MPINFWEKKAPKKTSLKSEYNKSAVVKVLKQTGKTNLKLDKSRDAKLPGKRISKTGKVYWETRKNRSDVSAITKV